MTERRKKIAANLCGAAWFVKTENIFYLTGYTGEGSLVLTKDRCVILTDSRYTEQASRQAPDCECIMTGRENPEKVLLAQLLAGCGAKECAFEADAVTVKTFEDYRAQMPGVHFVPLKGEVESLRAVKDEGEIACIRKAAEISCKAFEQLLSWVKVGMTEKQVQIRLDYEMLALGSDKNAFETIAAAGANGSLPHAVPSDRAIRDGELLTLDFGAQYKGYKADMTRTIGFGAVSDAHRAMYDAVLQAQLSALAAIRPGVPCKEVDRIARDYLDERYPGRFGHGLGHGVGLLIHEAPGLNTRDETLLPPGHVVTVEPGVYIPGFGGCRIEDMAIVTEDGYSNPITAPKHLITL